jgi:lipopolysaccharide transport system ATP-binding protein
MSNPIAISLEDVVVSYRKKLSLRPAERHTVLSGLSFDLIKGETLGIVGKNGAGKSTLLRLLAGVISPNRGTIVRNINRVSLLTLNLGLDPYLNGVDNARLSGLLLGISRQEIENSIKDIIEYSELGEAIYEPVRTYSSGMSARLGFSVGIHLHPDVLLIDEVLGVGDFEFRKKSNESLRKKIHSEQTVVLVSHNAAEIETLCNRVLWVENGKTRLAGSPEEVLSQYQNS